MEIVNTCMCLPLTAMYCIWCYHNCSHIVYVVTWVCTQRQDSLVYSVIISHTNTLHLLLRCRRKLARAPTMSACVTGRRRLSVVWLAGRPWLGQFSCPLVYRPFSMWLSFIDVDIGVICCLCKYYSMAIVSFVTWLVYDWLLVDVHLSIVCFHWDLTPRVQCNNDSILFPVCVFLYVYVKAVGIPASVSKMPFLFTRHWSWS